MTTAVEVGLWLIALLLLVPAAVLVAESWAALVPGRKGRDARPGPRPRCAVLVPAHDEEAGIGRTVAALLGGLGPGDRVVVVADNCTDGTAAAARACGATVVERNVPELRGKGYALDFGVRFLEQAPPDVVVIVDADCLVEEGGLDELVREAYAAGRPVQAAYELDGQAEGGARQGLSAFAVRYKNVVRPLGLRRLGLPCLLTGTGMAFPWALLRGAKLAHGNIVEDMQLGLDLAVAGHPPLFCPQARVRSELPAGRRAAASQRTRWEHGHLKTLLGQVPRLLAAGARRRRLDLIGLALELSVPPLSMLFLLWTASLAVMAGWAATGGSAGPATALAPGALAVLLSIFAAWVKFGRERLPLASLLAAPFYVLGKLPIYLAFLVRPQRAWVRTERDTSPEGARAAEKKSAPTYQT
jgi:cellulose synthase/poly-beta-1,6-N-acetylglucosamine synthase-like glycosyltransferase